MELKLFHQVTLAQLMQDIQDNLHTYKNGSFSYVQEDETLSFSLGVSSSIDLDMLKPIFEYNGKDSSPSERAATDIVFSALTYKAISGIDPSVARDPRLWNYLSHTYFLNYIRNRYPIPLEDEKAVKEVRSHFFCTNEMRSIERNHGVSRLWWHGYIVNRVDELGLDEALKAFLSKTDVRASILERPTTAQNVNVLTGILKALHKSLQSDSALFERKTFRELMKQINLWGGMILLGDLDQDDIDIKISELKERVMAP